MLYVYFISDQSFVTEQIPSVAEFDFFLTSAAYEEIVEILVSTTWDCNTLTDVANKERLLNHRNRILALIQYEIPTTPSISGKTTTVSSNPRQRRAKEKKDELDSYDALVREAGY